MKQFNSFLTAGIAIAFFAATNSFGQGQGETGNPHWNTGGNNASATDYFGTKNTRPVIFKTNNVERLRITETGFIGIDEPNPTERLHVKGNARVVGNFASTGTLEVSGTATFKERLTVEKGVMFDNDNGINFVPSDGINPSILSFGKKAPIEITKISPCLAPNVNTGWNAFNGFITSYGNSAFGGQINSMVMGFDGANGVIDIAGTSNSDAAPRLLINYQCGKLVAINTGANGGEVHMGSGMPSSKIFMRGATSIDITNQTALHSNTTHSGDWGYNFLASVNRDYTKAIAVYNNSTNKEKFVVYGNGNTLIDGQVGIGTGNPGSFKLAVEGKIGAREVEVTLASPWPDYVFTEKHSLMPLDKLESYLKKNKHLPNIPSAKEMEAAKGFSLGEMQVKHLEKTEELYLYIIELNKKIEKLVKENEELNVRLKKIE